MRKKISIVIGVCIILTVVCVVYFAAFRKSVNTLPVTGGVQPTITLVPTATVAPSQLAVLSSLPDQNQKTPYLPIQKITLVFSDTIKPELLKYEVSPKTELEILQGDTPQTLLILPKSKWPLGVNTITLLQATRSTQGKPLFAPFLYRLVIDIPQGPDPDVILP